MSTGRRAVHAQYDSASIEKLSVPSTVTQFTFLTLGVSSLLPWNTLIIALPFFLERLTGSTLYDTFPSWLSFLFNGVGLLVIGLATWLGGRCAGPLSITISLLTLAHLFGGFAIISLLELSPTLLFYSVILAGSLLAASSGLLQTATVTLADAYNSRAIASYMTGSALSAVGVSVLQVFISAGFNVPPGRSVVICFATAGGISTLTLVAYHVLNETANESRDQSDLCKDLPPSERTLLLEPGPRSTRLSGLPSRDSILPCGIGFMHNFSIFYVGVVTLALFPAITTLAEPNEPTTNPLLFNALHFLAFNAGDLLGRSAASTEVFSVGDTSLVTYSILRTAFVPLFLICNVPGHWPTLLTSDIAFMSVVFMFGLTCGHCTTLALVSASERGPEAARVAQFWMMLGFVVGGMASFGVGAIL